MAAAVDEARLEEFMGQLVGHMTGSAMCFGIWLGDELGLYRTLAELGATSADDLAAKAGCNPRLVREWLDGQVAGGLLTWDDGSDCYELGPEAAMALADDESPAFVARAMNAIGALFIDMPKVAEAFRGNGALSWGAHHPCLFTGTEWFFRTGYRAELPNWMGDPVGIARHALDHLADDGTVLLVEPFALDGRSENLAGNPMAALLYTASSGICTPNSLSQEVSASAPRLARPACARSSSKPATRRSVAPRRPRSTSSSKPSADARRLQSDAASRRLQRSGRGGRAGHLTVILRWSVRIVP
jgi:hypothetical protein